LRRIIIVIIPDDVASFLITILILDSWSICDPHRRLITSHVLPREEIKRIQPAWWPNWAAPSWRTDLPPCMRLAWSELTSTANMPRYYKARQES